MNLRRLFRCLLVCFIPLLFGCGIKNAEIKYVETEFFAMDTWMSVKLPPGSDEALLAEIEGEIRAIEGIVSVTMEKSELYRINNSPELRNTVNSIELKEMLYEAECMRKLTNKAFSETLYNLSREWGFTTGLYKVPEPDIICELVNQIANCRLYIDENNLIREPGVMLDFGGIAKGYATDRIVKRLMESDVLYAIISLGGNVYVYGENPETKVWSVGILDPFGNGILGITEVYDTAVVTSGSYERFFESEGVRYHHIIDSSTGYPANNGLVSVTVISKDASFADGLSTALFVMGLDEGTDFWRKYSLKENEFSSEEDIFKDGFEVIFITENKEIYYTEGLRDIFNCADEKYSLNIIPLCP